MTSFYISANSSSPQTLSDGETGFVTANGTLFTTTAPAVTLTGHGSMAVTVMGTIASSQQAIESALDAAVPEFGLTVGAAGSVISTGLSPSLSAIDISASALIAISNAGYITGARGIMANGMGSASFTLSNSGAIATTGTVPGTGAGITIQTGIAGAMVMNTGTISAPGAHAPAIERLADIAGTLEVINTGTIAGAGVAIRSAGTTTIRSSGLIQGDLRLEIGFVQNSGKIMGNVTGTGVEFHSLTLRNTGEITGDVLLGDAGGIYDGRGGIVHGVVYGGRGNDEFWIDKADAAIRGGAGVDLVNTLVSYRMAPDMEFLVGHSSQGLALTGRARDDQIVASAGGDTIQGRNGDDWIFGNEGDDLIHGQAGDDRLFVAGGDTAHGGTGDDRIIWSGGSVETYGGTGTDTLTIASGTSVIVDLAAGMATMQGGDTPGIAIVSGFENVALDVEATAQLSGSGGANALAGFVLADLILGGGGADTLEGMAGNDTLDGEAGADALYGGDGADLLIGGGAADMLTSGLGADTLDDGPRSDVFVYTSTLESTGAEPDLILGFSRTRDVIDLSLVDASASQPGHTPFHFIGTDAFDGSGGQLRYEILPGLTQILARLDGSSSDDLVVHLDRELALTATDFIL